MRKMIYPADKLLEKVNDALTRLHCDRKPDNLYDPINYVLSLGGKRIRPTLMLLAYNLFKDDPEAILMQAAGLETYHNYTLLHDDLMDNADLRRGHETVHKKWKTSSRPFLNSLPRRRWRLARDSSSISTSRHATM